MTSTLPFNGRAASYPGTASSTTTRMHFWKNENTARSSFMLSNLIKITLLLLVLPVVAGDRPNIVIILADEQSDRVKSMHAAWHAWAEKNHVLPKPYPRSTCKDPKQDTAS